MRTFARIDGGVVAEIITIVSDVDSLYHPDLVATLVEVTSADPVPGERWTYDGHAFSAPATPAVSEAQALSLRDSMLSATDWLVIRHRDQADGGLEQTLTLEQFGSLLAYRQALRDLPATYINMVGVVWPSWPLA